MTDWIEHNGGPQPVDDDVWLEATVALPNLHGLSSFQIRKARHVNWPNVGCYRILNQHLIDAARLEGIRLGLEAAATHLTEGGWVPEIMALNPETIAQAGLTKPAPSDLPPSSSDTIAREAVLDQLTREAQEQDMGYAKEASQ